MYGVRFDPGLYMNDAVDRLCSESSWKLNSILRTSRLFNDAHIVHLYKTKVLSFIEFRTSAIYHASDTLLNRVDCLQRRLIRSIGASDREALMNFRLAPLRTRRDIRMLGLIHRAVLGLGPDHFRKYIVRADAPLHPEGRNMTSRHNLQLRTYRVGKFLDLMEHSVFGLIDIYNLSAICSGGTNSEDLSTQVAGHAPNRGRK